MRITHRRILPFLWGAAIALPSLLHAQEPATITGRVTSAGQPLGQVEVAITTMGLGALTREDGRYTIVVPAARVSGQTVTLLVRRLGYRAQQAQLRLISGPLTQDFELQANPLQLGEIVVTGAGTATETEKLGNVRNNVNSDLIGRAGETNVVQALAAKAPNVTVLQQSGDPGSSSFINIRGINSILGGNQPLIVVDGVPIDNSTFSTSNFNAPDDAGGTLNQGGQTEGTVQTNRAADLNPNDIENVEILKGPAASAIYGARAAFGVILITTKSGRAGPTRFTFRSSVSLNDINHTYPLQTSFGQGTNGIHADTSLGGECDQGGAGNCSRSWGPAIPAGSTIYDHANDIYHMGATLDNGFTVSGGNDRTTFYLSGDNTHEQGVIIGPNNSFSRTAVRVKATHRVIDNLKLGGDIAFTDSRGKYSQRGNNTNGIQLGDLRTPPDFSNHCPDPASLNCDTPYGIQTAVGLQQRSYFGMQHPTSGDLATDRVFDNPFWTIFQQDNSSKVGRMFGNVNAEYLPVSWLKVNYTLGADYATDERLEGCPITTSSPCIEGRVVEGKIVNYQIDHNLTATASYRANPNVAGTVTIGQNLNSRNQRQLGTVGRTLVAPAPFKLANTVTQDLPIDQEVVIHDASWFGQGTVDLWSQLYLSAAIRNDGSSTFGRTNLRSWFPKGSAAWEFTKLTGDRLSSVLSYGKARIAYGEAGVEPLPYFTSQTLSSAIVGGPAQGTGNTPAQNGIGGLVTRSELKAATSLLPERSKEFEAGLDLGFLSDRADASITWYNKNSSDVILTEPLAPSTGFFAQAANAAAIRNRGWEVSLNLRPIQSADYGWDLGLQWARNRNTVLSVGSEEFIAIGDFNNQVAMKGKPFGVYLGSGFIRCGLSSDQLDVDVAGGGTAALGTVCAGQPHGTLYIGPDGYPVQDSDLRIVMDPNYNWTGSIRSSFRFRKVQIAGLFDIRHGGQIWNGTKGALWSYGTHKDTEVRATCTNRNDPTSCTGNPQVFGEGGFFNGPVVGPGAGNTVNIGEYYYRNVVGCPFIGIDEPCIEDAGFVKLREISVSYTLDQAWVQRTFGFSSIDLRVSGRNLHTWTNYTGYDPETNLGGAISSGAGASGVDYFNNPQTRSFVFAVTLNH